MTKMSILFFILINSITALAWHPTDELEARAGELKARANLCRQKIAKNQEFLTTLLADSEGQFILRYRLGGSFVSMTGSSKNIVCYESQPNNEANEIIRDLALNWSTNAEMRITSKNFIEYLGFNDILNGSCTLECSWLD